MRGTFSALSPDADVRKAASAQIARRTEARASLNVAAQMASPGWVKARALAVYLLVFQGAMTGGSVLWGSLLNQLVIKFSI